MAQRWTDSLRAEAEAEPESSSEAKHLADDEVHLQSDGVMDQELIRNAVQMITAST